MAAATSNGRQCCHCFASPFAPAPPAADTPVSLARAPFPTPLLLLPLVPLPPLLRVDLVRVDFPLVLVPPSPLSPPRPASVGVAQSRCRRRDLSDGVALSRPLLLLLLTAATVAADDDDAAASADDAASAARRDRLADSGDVSLPPARLLSDRWRPSPFPRRLPSAVPVALTPAAVRVREPPLPPRARSRARSRCTST